MQLLPACSLPAQLQSFIVFIIVVQVVISSAFESSIGLAQYAQLAAAVNSMSSALHEGFTQLPAHGLGTAHWFQHHAVPHALLSQPGSAAASVPIGPAEAAAQPQLLENASEQAQSEMSSSSIGISMATAEVITQQARDRLASSAHASSSGSCMTEVRWRQDVQTSLGLYSFDVLEYTRAAAGDSSARQSQQQQQHLQPTVLLMHGFLGQAEDWRPLASGLTMAGVRCVAVNLPGHGGSTVGSSQPGEHSCNVPRLQSAHMLI